MALITIKPGQKPAATTFTPTLSASANCTATGSYYKNADGQFVGSWRIVATGALGAGAVLTFTLPSSLALDTSRYLGVAAGDDQTAIKLPTAGHFWDQGSAPKFVGARSASATTFTLHVHGAGQLTDSGIAATDSLDFTLTLWVTGTGF
jgi:hypothetical protein